jgi:hypothetical protein
MPRVQTFVINAFKRLMTNVICIHGVSAAYEVSYGNVNCAARTAHGEIHV